jgi:hypothetical protein
MEREIDEIILDFCADFRFGRPQYQIDRDIKDFLLFLQRYDIDWKTCDCLKQYNSDVYYYIDFWYKTYINNYLQKL